MYTKCFYCEKDEFKAFILSVNLLNNCCLPNIRFVLHQGRRTYGTCDKRGTQENNFGTGFLTLNQLLVIS